MLFRSATSTTCRLVRARASSFVRIKGTVVRGECRAEGLLAWRKLGWSWMEIYRIRAGKIASGKRNLVIFLHCLQNGTGRCHLPPATLEKEDETTRLPRHSRNAFVSSFYFPQQQIYFYILESFVTFPSISECEFRTQETDGDHVGLQLATVFKHTSPDSF